MFGNTSENGQELPEFKTVGYLSNRYRLGHWWVPEWCLMYSRYLRDQNHHKAI